MPVPMSTAAPAVRNTSPRTGTYGPGGAGSAGTTGRFASPDHHQGSLDWDDCLVNQQRIGRNICPTAHQPGTGAVREGCA